MPPTDPTAADLIALVALEQKATRGEWHTEPSAEEEVWAEQSLVADCPHSFHDAPLVATLRNLEPRRTVRELVRVAAGAATCLNVGPIDQCSPCTARAWIAEQRDRGCVGVEGVAGLIICGTCVPCITNEVSHD